MKICIDAGHGGDDPGAVSEGIHEADINKIIAQALGIRLQRAGWEVTITHPSARAEVANRAGAHVFASIHCNAGPPGAHGFEVIYATGTQWGRVLAQHISDALIGQGITPRKPPVKGDLEIGRGNLTVLHKTIMPAVIVECGFVTCPDDRALLTSPQGQGKLVAGIVNGIVSYYTERFGTKREGDHGQI
jgi:N-acetylmuramoyl-L-alanine amidase